MFSRKLFQNEKRAKIDVFYPPAYKWSTIRKAKTRKEFQDLPPSAFPSVCYALRSQVTTKANPLCCQREPAPSEMLLTALRFTMMNPFLKPSFPFRFCSSFLSDMQTQPPCFPYNLIQSNICYIHTESCERSIRSHTITPQNAFNELPQSSLRAHRTSLRCTWGSPPTQAVQNVHGTCSP